MILRCSGVALMLALASCSGDDDVPLQAVVDGDARVTGQGVLVIVIDGLRWDHTTMAGYDRNTTPFLAKFAKTGIVFEDAWAPTASLLGSHIALLSGCDPSIAQPPSPREFIPNSPRELRDAWFIPEGLQLLSQPFLGAGFQTAAFVDHPMIAQLRGFDRGFKEFIEFGGNPLVIDQEIGVFGVGRRFVRWLNKLPIDEDWFAYVHMNDLERVWTETREVELQKLIKTATAAWEPRPELARVPPVAFAEPTMHALPPSRAHRGEPLSLAEYELRYDRGLRAMDASLKRLLGHADEFERSDLITVVIAGSFGTALGEHGLYLQAGLTEDEDLHVPIVVRPSKRIRDELGWTDAQRTSTSLSSLTDLTPTLIDLYGLRVPRQMHGVSLRPSMVDTAAPTRSRVFVASSLVPGWGVVTEDHRFALYDDRGTGPAFGKQTSQAKNSAPTVRGLEVEVFDARFGAVPGPEMGLEEDAAQRDALRAVGLRWESLLLDQRRSLHFGGEEVDTTRVDEIRALQLTLGRQPESHREPRSPKRELNPEPGSGQGVSQPVR